MVQPKGEIGEYLLDFEIEGLGSAHGKIIRYKAPLTVEAIHRALPSSQRISVWQEAEIYFTIGIKKGLEKGTFDVEVGDIAYWPMGDALCIFYKKIKPYSKVNILGKITKGLELIEKAKNGMRISIREISD